VNDDDMLAAMRSSLTGVKDSLAEVHMPWSADAIRARARRRRLGRGLWGAAAAGTALGVGLGLTLSSGGHPAAVTASPKSVHVNLAAWSVNTTSTGVVDVTIYQMTQPKLLGQTLAAAGVPALITLGAICYSPTGDASASVIKQVIVLPVPVPNGGELGRRVQPGGAGGMPAVAMFGIRPAAIPPGDEVNIGIQDVQSDGLPGASGITVTAEGSQLTCNIVPSYDGPPPPPPIRPAPKPASAYIVYSPLAAG
jgi:hypothetical protein